MTDAKFIANEAQDQMNGICEFCTCRGDIDACHKATCYLHENWYAATLNAEIIRLKAENEQLIEALEEGREIAKNYLPSPSVWLGKTLDLLKDVQHD